MKKPRVIVGLILTIFLTITFVACRNVTQRIIQECDCPLCTGDIDIDELENLISNNNHKAEPCTCVICTGEVDIDDLIGNNTSGGDGTCDCPLCSGEIEIEDLVGNASCTCDLCTGKVNIDDLIGNGHGTCSCDICTGKIDIEEIVKELLEDVKVSTESFNGSCSCDMCREGPFAEEDFSSSGVFVDPTITYANWEGIGSGATPKIGMGGWENTWVGVQNQIINAKVTGYGWRGFAIISKPAEASGYLDFSQVKTLRFYIKSYQYKANDIGLTVQTIDNKDTVTNFIIKGYGIENDLSEWTEVNIPTSTFNTTQITAIALIPSQANIANKFILVKEIAFLDENGNNVDVTREISWTAPKGEQSLDTALGSIQLGENSPNLVWSDEFEGSEIDITKWHFDIGRGESECTDGQNPHNWAWGNNEAQWYTDSEKNVWVSDGTLKMKAIREKTGDGSAQADWSSARLVTRNTDNTKGENKYGYIEMRAKIPDEKGLWPAFWMLRHDIYDEGGTGWPKGGEIDIMETSTNLWGTNTVYGTLHCQAGFGGNPIFTNMTKLNNITDWHTYGLLWKENGGLYWYYDGQLMDSYIPENYENDAWPYDENFFLILNLAVGGNLGGVIPPDLEEATMEIDYIRWYQ